MENIHVVFILGLLAFFAYRTYLHFWVRFIVIRDGARYAVFDKYVREKVFKGSLIGCMLYIADMKKKLNNSNSKQK